MADAARLERIVEEKDREIAELRSQLGAEVARLNRLVEVSRLLSSTLKVEELLELILGAAAELLDAETSSLFLIDENTGELIVEVAAGEPAETVVKQRVPAGEGIAGWVAANDEVALVEDPANDPRFYRGVDERTGFQTRNLLAAPMRTRERVIGVLEVINKRSGPFVDRDLEVATALAGQAGIAVDNARLYARLAEAIVTSRLSYRL
jgi:GAF domain-containing protein